MQFACNSCKRLKQINNPVVGPFKWESVNNIDRLLQKQIKIMPRSVNAVARRARRKKVLKQAKGYFGRRKNVWTVAKNAVDKAMSYAYRDRRNNKRTFRRLWIQRINAGARQHGMSYSVFMGKVKANNIELNRKVLADLAMNHPTAFKAVVDQVK